MAEVLCDILINIDFQNVPISRDMLGLWRL